MIDTIELQKAAKELMVSQLPIAEKDDVVFRAIELAVIEIYKRFNLSIQSSKLLIEKDKFLYTLDSKDFAQLITLQNSKGEELVPLNTIDDAYYDYKILNFNQIYIKEPKNEMYDYVYKASAPSIYKTLTQEGRDALARATTKEAKEEAERLYVYNDIPIPRDFTGALLDYIAYRCHVTLNSNQVYMTEIDLHYKRFELSCAELNKYGYKQEVIQTWKARDLGFK